MNICFLDGNDIPYTSKDVDTNKIRGAESILINLSRELIKLGNNITICNNCINDCVIDGVKWLNIKKIDKEKNFDVAITNNDMRLFDNIRSKKYFAFSHSIQTLEKFIRKGQLFSYLKYKPKIILLGNYHAENRNKLLKIFGSINIQWAVDEIFINSEIDDALVEDRAIFTSRRDRNLDILVEIWKDYIFKYNKNSRLFVTPSNLIDNNFNIFERNFSSRNLLINDLIKSRVFLVPGHKGELFCLAAEEARELCIPIVTLGIGSLSERVIHGKTGFIAKNKNQFANYSLDILKNDSIWRELRNNLLNLRGSKKWNEVAKQLLSKIQ